MSAIDLKIVDQTDCFDIFSLSVPTLKLKIVSWHFSVEIDIGAVATWAFRSGNKTFHELTSQIGQSGIIRILTNTNTYMYMQFSFYLNYSPKSICIYSRSSVTQPLCFAHLCICAFLLSFFLRKNLLLQYSEAYPSPFRTFLKTCKNIARGKLFLEIAIAVQIPTKT